MKRWLHRHGFGVQSPFAYEWVRDVFFESLSYYALDELKAKHHSDKSSKKDICRDEQLFRISNRLKPTSILLMGDIPEHSVDYLLSPCRDAECMTLKGAELQKLKQNCQSCGCFSLIMCQSSASFKEVYHKMKSLGIIGETTVMIVEDICRTQKQLWETIVADKKAITTFDMKYRGVVFFDTSRVKQNYTL